MTLCAGERGVFYSSTDPWGDKLIHANLCNLTVLMQSVTSAGQLAHSIVHAMTK